MTVSPSPPSHALMVWIRPLDPQMALMIFAMPIGTADALRHRGQAADATDARHECLHSGGTPDVAKHLHDSGGTVKQTRWSSRDRRVYQWPWYQSDTTLLMPGKPSTAEKTRMRSKIWCREHRRPGPSCTRTWPPWPCPCRTAWRWLGKATFEKFLNRPVGRGHIYSLPVTALNLLLMAYANQ